MVNNNSGTSSDNLESGTGLFEFNTRKPFDIELYTVLMSTQGRLSEGMFVLSLQLV